MSVDIEKLDGTSGGPDVRFDNPNHTMTNPNEALLMALDACRHKLTLYRNAHSGEYIGGIEYTALIKMIDEAIAQPVQPALQPLTDEQIKKGWEATFSTDNPFCPCNLKSFTKAAHWAEHAMLAAHIKAKDAP